MIIFEKNVKISKDSNHRVLSENKNEVIIMTKTIKKTLSLLLAAIMLFSLSIIGFAEDVTESEVEKFSLTSATVSAYSGDFKNQRADSIKLTIKTDKALSIDANFVLFVTGVDSTNRYLDQTDIISTDYTAGGVEIIFSYNGVFSHEVDYCFALAEGSFFSDGKISERLEFEVNGNLILEPLNVNRPSTTMQRLISWLESWKYAKYIQFIIDILKWFDTL